MICLSWIGLGTGSYVCWPLGVQMQNLFTKIRCEKIIFQLLPCLYRLYLYDSGIPVPVHIRKHSRYTGVRHVALTRWYTGF